MLFKICFRVKKFISLCFYLIKLNEVFALKIIQKIVRKEIKFGWLVKIVIYILLISLNSGRIFSNNDIFRNPQDIQFSHAQNLDNKLFQELVQADDECLDIAKSSLLIAKEVNAEINVKDYLECIDWYARMIKSRIQDNDGPETIVNIINDFLFNELGFTYVKTGNLEDLYLNDVIDRRKGNCVGMSILYLSIVERLQLPLFGVNVPEHIFIRYDDGETKINIETGHKGINLNDSFYITHSMERFDKTSIENGCYLRNLSKTEVIANIFLNRSKISRTSGNLKEALNDCNISILLKPEDPGTYCNRGVIYEKMGMITEAINDYGRAITLNHKYASAYYNRGSAFGVVDEIDKAIEDFNKAISINPEFKLSYYNRAIAFKRIGQTEKAIQDYNKVIDIDPDFAQAYCNRGVTFAETGRFDDAINDFNKAIELNPNHSDAYFARAIFFADIKELKKAIEDFGKCIELSPDKTFAYYLRGKAYKEIGKIDKAIQDFNKAITIRPYYAGLYVDRGIILFQAGRLDEAITDFDKSLELFPKNPIAYRYRGELFKKKGLFKKAIEDFESFLEIVPDSHDSKIIRNEILKLKKLRTN